MENREYNTETMESPRIQPEGSGFPYPEKLKRSLIEGLDANLWDELCIAEAEGDLDAGMELRGDAVFMTEAGLMRGLKLESDQSVRFEGKDSLKRGGASRSRTLWMAGYVAAAVAAAVAVIFVMPGTNDTQDVYSPGIAAVTVQPTVSSIPETPVVQPEEQKNSTVPVAAKVTRIFSSATANPPINPTAAPVAEPVETAAITPVAYAPVASGRLLAFAGRDIDRSDLVTTQQEEVYFDVPPYDEQSALLRALAERAGTEKVRSGLTRIYAGAVSTIDWFSEKSIIALNYLADEQTVVIKQYDSQGNITHRSVESETRNFQRDYAIE